MEEEHAVQGKKRFIDSIFPPKYHFDKMLLDQAEQTLHGVEALCAWLRTNELTEPVEIIAAEDKADHMRYAMESQLLEAFSTPFDRQDIYTFSRQMDYILNFTMSTALEMGAFGVPPDDAVRSMASSLKDGTKKLVEAIRIMEKDPEKADLMVKDMRQNERDIDKIYVTSMREVYAQKDPIMAMKKREIYHHLRDAGRTFGITIDILHRIIVIIV